MTSALDERQELLLVEDSTSTSLPADVLLHTDEEALVSRGAAWQSRLHMLLCLFVYPPGLVHIGCAGLGCAGLCWAVLSCCYPCS